MNVVQKYFPELNAEKLEKFSRLESLYADWNQKINVISRKDMEHFWEKHVLHSLSIAKHISFNPDTQILDIGTGGGFPGIPLAIMFPHSHFTLVDSIGKKIKVVDDIAQSLDLKNVTALHERAENINKKFDFVVSRAVTSIPKFLPWVKNKISHQHKNALPNGILYLKGGDISEELAGIKKDYDIYPLKDIFKEEFFETKVLIHIFNI